MKRLLGPKKRARLAGMFATFAQITLGAAFVSYFFREGGGWIRVLALVFFLATFVGALIAEPEGEGDS
jgi:hypothetical protein